LTEYCRAKIEGATYFFTVNCAHRQDNKILVEPIELLRNIIRNVMQMHPFKINAMVVLPDHLHWFSTLPPEDADYKTRWSLIKAGFSRGIPITERRSKSRISRGERGLWQRRYWEHMIRDDKDYERHVDYIHWNPVKHGWAKRVKDWPYSSFHKHVRLGIYPLNWGLEPEMIMDAGE
jgi:putative transposase